MEAGEACCGDGFGERGNDGEIQASGNERGLRGGGEIRSAGERAGRAGGGGGVEAGDGGGPVVPSVPPTLLQARLSAESERRCQLAPDVVSASAAELTAAAAFGEIGGECADFQLRNRAGARFVAGGEFEAGFLNRGFGWKAC